MTPLTFSSFRVFQDTQPSLYVGINFGCTILCFSLLLYIYSFKRHLCIRPSIIIGAFFNVFLQWPLTIYASFMEHWLPQPWDLTLAVNGSVLLGLLIAFTLPDVRLKTTWESLDSQAAPDQRIVNLGLAITGILGIGTLAFYFMHVPFTCTGFYGYAFYPESGALLREYSLKLLQSRTAVYAYTFYTSFISSLLFLFLLTKAQYFFKLKHYLAGVACLFLMIVTALLGCMEGASHRYLTYGLLFILFLLWNNRLLPAKRHVPWLVVVAGTLLCLQMVISLSHNPAASTERRQKIFSLVEECSHLIDLRAVQSDRPWQQEMLGLAEASDDSTTKTSKAPIRSEKNKSQNILERALLQLPSIGNRIFIVPFRVGSWYYHYVQTQGPIGIAGIPRLARLADIEPVSIGNIIGLAYGPDYYGRAVVPVINASAGFIFTLYAFFGFVGIFFMFVIIAALDLLVLLIQRLASPLNTIFLTFMTIICLNLMQADIGYLLYSGGLLPAAIILALIHLTVWGYDRYRKPSDHPSS